MQGKKFLVLLAARRESLRVLGSAILDTPQRGVLRSLVFVV